MSASSVTSTEEEIIRYMNIAMITVNRRAQCNEVHRVMCVLIA